MKSEGNMELREKEANEKFWLELTDKFLTTYEKDLPFYLICLLFSTGFAVGYCVRVARGTTKESFATIKLFQSKKVDEKSIGECSVCFKTRKLCYIMHENSGHLASCKTCTKEWMEKNDTCPVCRKKATHATFYDIIN